MKKNYFLMLIVLGFFSCQKELSKEVSDTEISNTNARASNANTSQQVDVYVAGTEAKASGHNTATTNFRVVYK